MVLTPNFQNPTGTTIPEAARTDHSRDGAARRRRWSSRTILYGELRYHGAEIPVAQAAGSIGRHDSAVQFFEDRVSGAARRLGHRAAAFHRAPDRSQGSERSAFGSAFASRAAAFRANPDAWQAHRQKMLASGRGTFESDVSTACAKELPPGSRLHAARRRHERVGAAAGAAGCIASWPRARSAKASAYLPGRYFAVSRPQTHGLRLSFAGLMPEQIRAGLRVLGQNFRSEFERRARDATNRAGMV